MHNKPPHIWWLNNNNFWLSFIVQWICWAQLGSSCPGCGIWLELAKGPRWLDIQDGALVWSAVDAGCWLEPQLGCEASQCLHMASLCSLDFSLVIKGRPDSKEENWSLPLDVRSSMCISRGKESMADILETFYYRLSWGKSPNYHYKWVTICSLQLLMFSQLIFRTTNNKIVLLFSLYQRGQKWAQNRYVTYSWSNKL